MDDLSTFLVKGAPMVADLQFIRTRHGEEGLSKVLDAMSPEDAETYRHRLLPGSWYAMAFRVSLLEAVDKVFAKGNLNYFFEMGCHQAEHNLAHVYRNFSRVVGDKATAKLSEVFWGLIYKSSRIETHVSGREFLLEVFEYPKISVNNCHVVRGYVHRALVLTGARKTNVTSTELSCLNCGADHCKFLVTWH
jgi:predicted hydrocarbon binding protein